MIERIKDNQELLAVILRDEYVKEGYDANDFDFSAKSKRTMDEISQIVM